MRSDILRRIVANTLLAACGTAVALVASELLVRRIAPQHFPLAVALRGLHQPDAKLGYVMVPGFAKHVHAPEFTCDVRTNGLGIRDREIGPRVPGRLRLLALGDSFTLGIHAGDLDSCFVKRLETELREQLPDLTAAPDQVRWQDAEVVNAGVDGYGTAQEIDMLRRLGPGLQPDGVLLAFYLGNDFTDNSGRTRMTVVDGYQMLEASAAGFRNEFRPWHRQVRLWLHSHSELYVLLKARLLHPVRAVAPLQPGDSAGPKPFDYYVYDKGFADALQDPPAASLAAAIDSTGDALRAMRRWCDTHHATALVVAIPAEQQVDPAARSRWVARFGLDASKLDFESPNRTLAALAAASGLPFFDLTPEFAARIANGDSPYLATDTHWNVRGHAIAARALAAPVLEHLAASPLPVIGTR